MNEGFYIMATGLIMLAYFGVRAYFQRRYPETAEAAADKEARRQKSLDSLIAAGQIPVLAYLLTPALNFAQVPIPEWLRWLGALIGLCAVGFFYWTHRLLGPNWICGRVLRREHNLVTNGPYHVIRHPMYLSILFIALGITLLTANWLVGIGLIAPTIVMIFQRVPAEEAALTARFGDKYRTYVEDTGAFFPRLFH
jgi:protein-S-isoprenylcysteine O-methyltransferase Ste14